AGIIATLGLVALLTQRAISHGANATASVGVDTQPSVAVLPFLNLSADHDGDYFGDGLAEQLITALAGVPNLRVAARTSTFRFKGKDTDLEDIGRKLNVRYVVEGSVRQSGEQLVIAARLIDVRTGDVTWSGKYDRKRTDIFAIQEELSLAIVTAVEGRLALNGSSMRLRRTTSMAAYDAFLQGRYHFNLRAPDHAEAAGHD